MGWIEEMGGDGHRKWMGVNIRKWMGVESESGLKWRERDIGYWRWIVKVDRCE